MNRTDKRIVRLSLCPNVNLVRSCSTSSLQLLSGSNRNQKYNNINIRMYGLLFGSTPRHLTELNGIEFLFYINFQLIFFLQQNSSLIVSISSFATVERVVSNGTNGQLVVKGRIWFIITVLRSGTRVERAIINLLEKL